MSTQIESTRFSYDYGGQRVKKNFTVYIGKFYERTGTTCTKYIFADDKRVAMKSSSNIYYYHTGHLGSSSVMTDKNGNKIEDLYYYPYGKVYTDTGSIKVKHKFTKQEFDTESGLYYYGVRWDYSLKLCKYTTLPKEFATVLKKFYKFFL